MKAEVREVRVGTVPSWMEYAGCMYHTYPCNGATEACIPTFKIRRTYRKTWRSTWQNKKVAGCSP